MITGMNHITLAVKDIDISFDFYTKIIGLKPLVKWDKGAYFLVDSFWFCLNVDKNREANPCYTHYAFSVPQKEFDSMVNKIMNSGAVVFKDNTSPGDSFYFLDPDDHKLEIHAGDWETRIDAKKANVGEWKDVKWFV